MSEITHAFLDGETEQLYIGRVDATGALVAARGSISLKLSDANPDATSGRVLKLGWLDFYAAGTTYGNDADGNAMIVGQRYQSLVLMSAPKKLTGTVGGSSVQRFRVKQVLGDYLLCHKYPARIVTGAAIHSAGTGYPVGATLTVAGGTGTAATLNVATVDGSGGITGITISSGGEYDADPPIAANAATGGGGSGATFDLTMGSGEGAVDVKVAKPPELRHSLVSEPIEGSTITYSYAGRANNADGQRTAHDGVNPDQTEIVEPVYHTNTADDGNSGIRSEIWADQPQGGTGALDEGGTEIVWMDTNRAARAWTELQS